jgi:hypothetical protein
MLFQFEHRHHGIRSIGLNDGGWHQRSSAIAVMNTSPPTSIASFGAGGDVFLTQQAIYASHSGK